MRRDQIERGNQVVAVKVGFGLLELQPAEAGEWEEVPPDGTPLTSSPNPRFRRVRPLSSSFLF